MSVLRAKPEPWRVGGSDAQRLMPAVKAVLGRRKRAERALTTVVATCYLLGVSTRRMDRLVETLGITGLSKSQVSVMAKELDTAVEAFRTRPLDAGPYTFVPADALVLKVRETAGSSTSTPLLRSASTRRVTGKSSASRSALPRMGPAG